MKELWDSIPTFAAGGAEERGRGREKIDSIWALLTKHAASLLYLATDHSLITPFGFIACEQIQTLFPPRRRKNPHFVLKGGDFHQDFILFFFVFHPLKM